MHPFDITHPIMKTTLTLMTPDTGTKAETELILKNRNPRFQKKTQL